MAAWSWVRCGKSYNRGKACTAVAVVAAVACIIQPSYKGGRVSQLVKSVVGFMYLSLFGLSFATGSMDETLPSLFFFEWPPNCWRLSYVTVKFHRTAVSHPTPSCPFGAFCYISYSRKETATDNLNSFRALLEQQKYTSSIPLNLSSQSFGGQWAHIEITVSCLYFS